jgi:uncharacterized membrane protein
MTGRGSPASTKLSAGVRRGDASARVRLGASLVAGIIVGVTLLALDVGQVALLVGWDSAAVVYVLWMWSSIWSMTAEQTSRRSIRTDPGKAATDVLLLSASVASLAAVGAVLVKAGTSSPTTKGLLAGLSVVSVVLAWTVVHTVFTLHYARLYYTAPEGGVDFNEASRPRYADFAYLAFTLGMTFQVSDTALTTREVRATALRHALLSYLFGAVIIATTINLVAGLTAR